jgi:hypothetical protein
MSRTIWAVLALIVVIGLAMYLFADGAGDNATTGDQTITTPAPVEPVTPPAPATPPAP